MAMHSRDCGSFKDRRLPCTCGKAIYTVAKALAEAEYYKSTGIIGGAALYEQWLAVADRAGSQVVPRLVRGKYDG